MGDRFRLRTRLAVIAVTAVAVVFVISAVTSLRLLRARLLETLRAEASTQSDGLRIVLEHEMLEGDRTLLGRLVDDIGRQPTVQRVMVLDRGGRVRVSSDPRMRDHVFDREAAAECAVCHRIPAALRDRSVTMHEASLGGVFRTVTPMPNREACHRCHSADQRLNGILIVDRSLARLDGLVASSRRDTLIAGAAGMLALLASLGFAVERLVLRRLWRLKQFTRRLATGDLGARVALKGDDEIASLATDFDTMARQLEVAVVEVNRERRQLDELINGIDDGVLLLDSELRIVTINHALATRLDVVAAAAAGTVCFRAALNTRSCGGDPSVCPAARALATGKLEKHILRMAGTSGEHFEEIYATPLRSPTGETVAVVEVWRDITDRKLLEAELVQSERLASLGLLASGVAHEVGNPLASIATAVEGLLRRMDQPEGAPPDEVREYLEIVSRQVFRCRGVTERLLGFARRSTGERRAVDPAAVAQEVLALCAPQARSQRVRVETAFAPGLRVEAEDQILDQVFLNLVTNALQAMPGGGVLKVETRAEGATARIAVSDTGRGIPREVREHLFEPFRTARPSEGGTGLGLFLCQVLLERCGGGIEVASEVGQGTTLTLRLPLARAALVPALAAHAESA